jgi:NAD(P)-dependent dehydrogenase (short-subunit alcohol dehydrogenase family)
VESPDDSQNAENKQQIERDVLQPKRIPLYRSRSATVRRELHNSCGHTETSPDEERAMDRDFDGKVALVTAAGSGIGRAIAQAFARKGAKVMVGDISEQGGAETVELIRQSGGEARFQRMDVTREEDIAALVAAAVAAWGRLDAAANNAGHPGRLTTVLDCTNEEWELVHNMNLRSSFWGIKHQARAMLDNGGGAIVNTASVAGLSGERNLASYIAMKHGVVGLTRSAALDLGKRGIRVNAIAPGFTQTPMAQGSMDAWGLTAADVASPLGRIARPEEQAEAAVWLCSEHSSYVNGTILPVDGGGHAM